MARFSTADADASNRRAGTPGRGNDAGRPITLWFVTGAFALSAAMTFLGGDSTLHSSGVVTPVLTGIIQLVIAGGLWYRQQWAIVSAVALQALGLLLAFLTIDFPGVVISIVLLGAMFAIPPRVWQ